jgi:uncharacterized OB-fold protein
MGSMSSRPLPRVSEYARPFWEGVKAGKLLIQRCRACGSYQHYPRPGCASCGSRELEWVESSGRGRIYSVTVPRVVIGEMKAFEGEMPYAIAMVDLEEEVRILARVTGYARPEDVSIGDEVVFEPVDVGGFWLPYFHSTSSHGITGRTSAK